jgi:hypothetical protein
MPTKLGAHVLRSASLLGEFIQARPAVVKFVGDWGTASSVPEGVLVIGAKAGSYDAQLQRTTGKTPREAAEQFVGDMRSTYEANPAIKYWEGHNEPVWNEDQEIAWYAQFEIERMKIMADMGLKCVIGNYASGTPPLNLWPAFVPALEVARDYEAILGVHEYSCPWMWWMTGKYQIDPDEDQGDEGWSTLRYRKVYRHYLAPAGVGDVPLVITETGIDPLVNPKPPGAKSGTWSQLGDYWREHDNEPDKADYYFRQLVWYDKELQKDDYVIGATIFTFGNWGGTWKHFDIAGSPVTEKLVVYTQNDPAKPFVYPGPGAPSTGPTTPTGPTEPEEEDRGKPREQYERTYVLLPPDADAAWAQAVVQGAWDAKRFTIGSSADDAGIGDLDTRRVIAVNPQNWPGPQTLEAFFAKYYPGVEYVPVTASSPQDLAQKLENM